VFDKLIKDKIENIYINSIESSDLYEYMQGRPIKNNYIGMIPHSLESIKLRQLGLKIYEDRTGKNKSNDIINVKFNTSVKHFEDIISKYDIYDMVHGMAIKINELESCKTKSAIKHLEYTISNMENMINYIKLISSEKRDKIKSNDLRIDFYKNGFNFKGTEYQVYKRTSAKSRTGECLFIKKQLRNKSIKWARLGMNLDNMDLDSGVDYPSLLAYESLVGSSIIGRVEIDTKNIFIVSDIVSKFNTNTSVITNNSSGTLSSVSNNDYEIISDLFDGEALLDESYFVGSAKGKGSMLLRHHMFKSCAFNSKVQKFLIDSCPRDIEYNEWQLDDMFGNKVYAKDIMLITTPNSLKALKFYKRKKTKKLMYEHWCRKVNLDNNLFGVCKFEKKSKRGYHDDGQILNRTSYQMLNSIPFTKDDIKELSTLELNYIDNLKNDINVYMEFLEENKNDINSNEMLINLYRVNNDLMNTESFKLKRARDIKSHINIIKRGKIRMKGDYLTICQNPKELLYHTINKLPVDRNVLDFDKWKSEIELIDNQAHIILHDMNREYTCFRNPHTSPSNVLILENKESLFITKYMNPSNNIIYTNGIGIEISRILSGADMDSDTVLVLDNQKLLEVSKKCYGNYNVCDNNVSAVKVNYKVNSDDMAKIDVILSTSQTNIGRVVNIGQIAMSLYWDIINTSGDSDKAKEILKQVDICTVLSEIAIDMAKKLYEIDFTKQIKEIEDNLGLNGVKPKFFSFISRANIKSENLKQFECSMDYLYDITENIKRAKVQTKTIDFLDLLTKNELVVTRRSIKQKSRIDDIAREFLRNRTRAYINYDVEFKYGVDIMNCQAHLYDLLDNANIQCKKQMSKYKLLTHAINHAIKKVLVDDTRGRLDLTTGLLTYLKVLYDIDKDKFLDNFRWF